MLGVAYEKVFVEEVLVVLVSLLDVDDFHARTEFGKKVSVGGELLVQPRGSRSTHLGHRAIHGRPLSLSRRPFLVTTSSRHHHTIRVKLPLFPCLPQLGRCVGVWPSGWVDGWMIVWIVRMMMVRRMIGSSDA